MSSEKEEWLYEIKPKDKLLSLNFEEIWRYRDLLLMFVKRDIVTYYKQTILGPLWFLIQPLITSVVQFVIFDVIADIQSDGVPYFLFVLAGNTLWSYFSECFKSTSDTFKTNQSIFGKVYFPRVIMPLSVTVSSLLKFGIQFALFITVLLYCCYRGLDVHPNWTALFIPFILLAMALLSLGFGMIISSLTTKYRDLTFVVSFGIQLYMYVTPIIYPLSTALEKVPEKWHWLLYANPLTNLFEFFKYGFLGKGTFSIGGLLYSFAFSVIAFLLGLIIFNKTEKSFIDTV